MKPKHLLSLLFGLCAGLLADAIDPMDACDQTNDSCIQRCDGMENVDASCFDGCEKQYLQCLDHASDIPESDESPAEEER